MTDVVYFIEEPGGLIKIGWSSNVERRIAALSNSANAKLKLLATTPGPMSLERLFHRRFAKDRVRGEWFRNSIELASLMEACARGEYQPDTTRRLSLSFLLTPLERLVTADDTIAIIRPLLEEFIAYYELHHARMVAIDMVSERLGLSTDWVRKTIVGYGHKAIAAENFANIIAGYAQLQRDIQEDAAARARLAKTRQEEADRVVALLWGEIAGARPAADSAAPQRQSNRRPRVGSLPPVDE